MGVAPLLLCLAEGVGVGIVFEWGGCRGKVYVGNQVLGMFVLATRERCSLGSVLVGGGGGPVEGLGVMGHGGKPCIFGAG